MITLISIYTLQPWLACLPVCLAFPLQICGWLPGVVHAIYLIFATPSPTMLGGTSTTGGTVQQTTTTGTY